MFERCATFNSVFLTPHSYLSVMLMLTPTLIPTLTLTFTLTLAPTQRSNAGGRHPRFLAALSPRIVPPASQSTDASRPPPNSAAPTTPFITCFAMEIEKHNELLGRVARSLHTLIEMLANDSANEGTMAARWRLRLKR